MDLSTPALPVSLPTALPAQATGKTATLGRDETAVRARIDKAGKDYESAFLSIMLGQMMSGVKTTTFGGGDGEDAFKSFMTDAMAKSIVKHGGIGLAKPLSMDMLKLQGLSATPSTTAAKPSATKPSANAPPVAPTLDIAA